MWNDVALTAQPSQRALGIERPHGLFIDVGAIRVVIGEAVEAVRLAAWSETVRKQRNVAVFRPILTPHRVPLRQAARIARRRTGTRHQRAILVDVRRRVRRDRAA